MMYAINLADLTKYFDNIAIMILVEPVLSAEPFDVNPERVDGVALTLDCDDDRASAIVKVIRKRIPKHALRCYQKVGSRWKTV